MVDKIKEIAFCVRRVSSFLVACGGGRWGRQLSVVTSFSDLAL